MAYEQACESHALAERAEASAWGDAKRDKPKSPEKWSKAIAEMDRATSVRFARFDAIGSAVRRRVQYESFSPDDRAEYAIHLAEGRA